MFVKKNKRKRASKDLEKYVDEVDAIPSKIQKLTEKTAILGEENNSNEAVVNESISENSISTGKQLTFSKDFKIMSFRAKLKTGNFLTELQHFLFLAETKHKMIAKFLEKRGKPLELVEALDRIDKSNTVHISYLCNALQMVLMEIIINQKDQMESALQACRYFLKSHGSVLNSLIVSKQHEHRRIVLKLMTALVCVEPLLGKQLLISHDHLTNFKIIESFLSHPKHETDNDENVRKCYIHFVLAFLVDGNPLLIQSIVDRGHLIRSMIRGLIYDDDVTVCVVLSTLKKSILESNSISKTKKIHLFDFDCCKNLIMLYDWKGPKAYSEINTLNGDGSSKQFSYLIRTEAHEKVSNQVHDFLVILLTSRKNGIAFDALSSYRQKHNVIQGKLMGWLLKPWDNPLKTDLIIKVITSCPELSRNTMRNFSRSLYNPNLSGKQRSDFLNFIKQFIDVLRPTIFQSSFQHMTLTDLSHWIKETLLPMDILKVLRDVKTATDEDFNFRITSAKLLLSMFTQYSNFMKAITLREQSKSDNSMRRFKFDLLSYLLLYFPTVENILLGLRSTVKGSNLEITDIHAHLEVVFDTLLVIFRENRSFIDKTNSVLDFLLLLRPLYTDGNSFVNADHHNIKLELKAIKTILLLFPQVLEPQENLFSSVVASFIKVFVYGTEDLKVQAGALLRGIFKNTGIFNSSELEIDIWLEALRFFDTKTVEVVIKVIVEVLRVTKASVDTPKTAETVANRENLHKLFHNIEKGLSVQANMEIISLSKLILLIFKGVEIVDPLKQYIEVVFLLMFHYHPAPEYIKFVYEIELTSLKPYMNGWLNSSKILCSNYEDTANQIPNLIAVQTNILTGQPRIEDIFNCSTQDNCFVVDFNGHTETFDISLKNERLVMIYIQEVLFIVAQLVEKQLLAKDQAERAVRLLTTLIKIIRSKEVNESNEYSKEEFDEYLPKVLKYIFEIRLNYFKDCDLLSGSDQSHLNYLFFLRELIENCKSFENFDNYTVNFRLKLVKSVAISLENVEKTNSFSDQLEVAVKLYESLNLSSENCLEILNLLASNLSYADLFFQESNGWKATFFYDLLCCVLRQLGSTKQCVECREIIKKFCKIFIDANKYFSDDLHLDKFEESFFSFLKISYQNIQVVGSKFFDCFFNKKKLTKSSIQLACLLYERNKKLEVCLLNNLSVNLSKRELVYPLLKIAFRNSSNINFSLLQSVYQEYKNGFMKTIEKPQKAGLIYKENVECSIALVEKCMPKSECIDFTNKSFKFDIIETFQVRIIEAIYKKALNSSEDHNQKSSVVVNFVNLLIQMLTINLKKQNSEQGTTDLIAFYLFSWLTMRNSQTENKNYFEKTFKYPQWITFCKTCLKSAMHINESEAENRDCDRKNGLLLKLLAFLCNELYVDSSEVEEASQELFQLYEMIITHSKFFEIVLNHNSTDVKTQVLHLLYILAKKSPSALSKLKIPVILGAYQARLFDSDRYCLALLQLYETHEYDLEYYKPFIWGESAISFYSLRSSDNEEAILSRQETSIVHVMSLVDKQLCDYTLENFPSWRKLNSLLQMPSISFHNPDKDFLTFGSNYLENRIEGGVTKFTEDDRRFCPKRFGVYENCYDPAFIIPLMNMCFAPESFSHPARPVQNGLLSISFAALSSQDKDMRLAAASVQLRYRAHFEMNKFFEKPLWIQAYNNIQCGLSQLRDSWMKHKKNSGTPRVSYIPCLFIGKTFNISADPTHLLYKQLTMYLRLKSSFNFETIPEFNILFFSPEVEHTYFRQFIIKVIKSGAKTSSDIFLLFSTNTFKVLMGFYGSTMSSLEINLLILSLFSTCVKIPGSTKLMLDNVGVLSWLASIVSSIEFYQFDVIEGIIIIVSNFWYALKVNADDFHNFSHISSQIHNLLLQLCPHLSPRISVSCFAKFVNILHKTSSEIQYAAMSSEELDHLIYCSSKHFPEHSQNLVFLKQFGGNGAPGNESYCKELSQNGLNHVDILALSSIRFYIIEWFLRQNIS